MVEHTLSSDVYIAGRRRSAMPGHLRLFQYRKHLLTGAAYLLAHEEGDNAKG